MAQSDVRATVLHYPVRLNFSQEEGLENARHEQRVAELHATHEKKMKMLDESRAQRFNIKGGISSFGSLIRDAFTPTAFTISAFVSGGSDLGDPSKCLFIFNSPIDSLNRRNLLNVMLKNRFEISVRENVSQKQMERILDRAVEQNIAENGALMCFISAPGDLNALKTSDGKSVKASDIVNRLCSQKRRPNISKAMKLIFILCDTIDPSEKWKLDGDFTDCMVWCSSHSDFSSRLESALEESSFNLNMMAEILRGMLAPHLLDGEHFITMGNLKESKNINLKVQI